MRRLREAKASGCGACRPPCRFDVLPCPGIQTRASARRSHPNTGSGRLLPALTVETVRGTNAPAMNGTSLNYVEMVTHGGPVVSGVLIILVLSSLASWTIIFRKLLHLRRAQGESLQFLETFWRSKRLGAVYTASEALIATAMGLFAAIPALVAYNAFNSRIRVLDNEMRNFSADFLNIIKRHIFKKAA